jgi:hypothetical protein
VTQGAWVDASTPRSGFSAPEVRRLAALNAIGGACVLASYAWGFVARPDSVGALWGGVPDAIRPLYTLNMLLAAAGYFLFTPFILFRLPPAATTVAGGFGYGWFGASTALVLFPSALWMPLGFLLLDHPTGWLFWLVRLDLAAVALGSLGLLYGLVALRSPRAPRGRALAVAGLVPFCIQTAALDAVVWPAFLGS